MIFERTVNKPDNDKSLPREEAATPDLKGESQWIMRAISRVETSMDDLKKDLRGDMKELKDELQGDTDKLKKPVRRIERMLWSIIGAITLILLLFNDDILGFIRDFLTAQ